MTKTEIKQIRCAIYTRKSTNEGADQDFTSLDNQRESAENYIASQKSPGWVVVPEKYDDYGYTGANMERPALERLLIDLPPKLSVQFQWMDRLFITLPQQRNLR